jgi:hypothetical protein
MTSSAGVQIPALPLAVGARPATRWLVAVQLLRRGPSAPVEDVHPDPMFPLSCCPSRFLLPEYRQPWGAAMSAELTEVRGPAARRRFAAGCIRATWAQPASTALLLAATLAGFGWLALRPPLRLVEDRLASGIAIGALTIAAG